MAHVSIDRHIPVPPVMADPARQEISFTVVVHLTVTMRGDEARQFGDQYMAALAGLAVQGAELAEVSEA